MTKLKPFTKKELEQFYWAIDLYDLTQIHEQTIIRNKKMYIYEVYICGMDDSIVKILYDANFLNDFKDKNYDSKNL